MNDVLNADPREIDVRRAVPMPMSGEAKAKFRIADAMRRWCIQSLGPRLEAVILTGSLARDEATFSQSDGCLRFLSDAEFIVILQDRTSLPSAETITLICRGAEEELRNQGVACKLSLSPAHESYLSHLGETIFGYELLTCGEVIYGDPKLVMTRAEHVTKRISHEDAWRLLANRTVELLEILPEICQSVAFSEAAQYRLIKLYLDMTASLLVFKEEFVAGYQARATKLHELDAQGKLDELPFDVERFVATVDCCTEYKIKNIWPNSSPFGSHEVIGQAIDDLRSLWSWELSQMNAVAVNPPDQLLRTHMRNQKFTNRLRGWSYVARREGLAKCLTHAGRWVRLSRSASPRYCLYASALCVLRGTQVTASNPELDLEAARQWLPVIDSQANDDLASLVNAILWNYQRYLAETTA